MPAVPVGRTRFVPAPARAPIAPPQALASPLTRLFDHRDIEFLRSVPGYGTRAETPFRHRRCLVFLAYLRAARAELAAARAALDPLRRESPQVYRQLAPVVRRCRVRFAWTLLPASLRLIQYRYRLGRVDLAPVVRRVEAIRGEIRRLVSAFSPPPARS